MPSPIELVFGSKPEVAPYTPTHYPQEQLKTILANISAFPDIEQLGNLYEQYMMGAFNEAIPGFSDILSSGGNVTREMLAQSQSLLEGKVPQDVQDQIRRQDALTSMLSGGPGGASALTSRDLGLTSLNLINQGANLAGQAGNAAQRWAGIAQGMIMNPAGMMFTPQQQVQQEEFNRIMQQTTKQLGYNIAAAPDPAAAGISGTIMNLLGAYLGHGMGGGGGSITPSYGSFTSSYGTGTQGGMNMAGMNFGGTNPYTATTGGLNFGGSNYGGQDIPYMGG